MITQAPSQSARTQRENALANQPKTQGTSTKTISKRRRKLGPENAEQQATKSENDSEIKQGRDTPATLKPQPRSQLQRYKQSTDPANT